MMISEKARKSVRLAPSDFFSDAHQKVYEAVQLAGAADPIIVADVLSRHGQLEAIGGKSYLFALVKSVSHTAHIGHHARIVAECALLRNLIDASTTVIQKAHDRQDAQVLAQEAKEKFSALSGTLSDVRRES